MTLDEFFQGDKAALRLFAEVQQAIARCGLSSYRVTKSQVAFKRKKGFAWVWRPAMYLKGERPPLVLTVALHRRDLSPRWKQVVEPYPGRFTHHLELTSAAQIDDEVRLWLAEAWDLAG